MDNMAYFFTDKYGRTWYICRDCGHKEQYKPHFCPVCRNTQRNPNKENQSVIDMLIATEGGTKKL